MTPIRRLLLRAVPDDDAPPGRHYFPLRRITPNLVTLAALCLGLTSIRQGLSGRFDLGASSLLGAIVLDVADGRLARLLRAESRLGAQLDSLADFLNFGIAPVLLLYLWSLHATERIGWVVLLIYAVCCALRLARFNVSMDAPDRPAWSSKFFKGVPAPAAGALVLWPVFLEYGGVVALREHVAILLGNVLLVGLLMVSDLPTFSSKGVEIRVRRDRVLPLMAASGVTGVLLFTFPWVTVSAVCLAYYLIMPISFFRHRRLRAASDVRSATVRRAVRSRLGEMDSNHH